MKKYLSLLLLLLMVSPVWAVDWQEGQQYNLITPVPAEGQGDQVEVVEFFWYGCPHCFMLEPSMKEWLAKKPENIQFVRVPVMFGGAANMHAKAYYALEAIGEAERLHESFFEVINKEKRKLRTREALDKFLAGQNVDMEKFNKAMKSFAVQTKANRSAALMKRYGIRSVPTLVIDGRYRTGTGFAGYHQFTEVTDFLVAKVIEDRK